MNKLKPIMTSVTLEELFKVLNFYAEKENYLNLHGSISRREILFDKGSKARKILKKFLKDGFFHVKI